MGAFDANGRLRHLGALKLLGDAQTPLAERPIKVADRLAAVLLGGRMDESPAADAAADGQRCPRTTRAATRRSRRWRALLARPSHLPIVLAGPDADTLLATAYGRPLVAVHVRDIGDRDVMAEAALVVRARGPAGDLRRASRTSSPPSAGGCCARSSTRPERTILAAPTRTAALALGERTVLLVEAAAPVLRRAPAGLGRPHRHAPRPATSRRSSGSR